MHNTDLKNSKRWLTIVPSTDDTVDETCDLASCEGVVLEVAAVVDQVELLGGVVVVEAEWLRCPSLGPGALPDPLGCTACHVEVEVGIFATGKAVIFGSHELSKHPVLVIDLLLVVQLS